MSSHPLKRTVYSKGNVVHQGDTSHGESMVDMESYYQPLEQIHTGAHEWGVISGLEVLAMLGQSGVRVKPGTALDSNGKHISLAATGKAELNSSPVHHEVNLTEVADEVTLPNGQVIPAGVVLSTTGLLNTSDKYVTIMWLETFADKLYTDSMQQIYQSIHSPWLQLQDAAIFDGTPDNNNGEQIILARISLDNAGNVTGITHQLRRQVGLPAERLRLRRGVNISNSAVGNVDSGMMSARPTGGIDLTVPNSTDEIHLSGAQRIVAERDGKESIVIDHLANISVGTAGNEGDILVFDSKGKLAIALDGGHAELTVGAPNNPGSIRTLNSASQTTFSVDGSAGSITTDGDITANGSIRVNGVIKANNYIETQGNIGASGGITSRGDIISGGDIIFTGDLYGRYGDATKAHHVWLYAQGTTHSVDVHLGSRKRVFALIMLSGVRLGGASSFSGLAFIESVDGTPLPNYADPAYSAWTGSAETIRFGLTTSTMEAWALAIVFSPR